jgi:hypothetical protein
VQTLLEALLMSQTLPLRKATKNGSDCNKGFVAWLILKSNKGASRELGGISICFFLCSRLWDAIAFCFSFEILSK